jgi:DUF971 family protein
MSSQIGPWPTELRLYRRHRRLEIDFDDGLKVDLPAPLLRAMTPSAADRGHGAVQNSPLPGDFSGIALLGAYAIGSYAVRLEFSDGHDTGLYNWEMLHRIGRDKVALTAEQQRLSRDAPSST